jgi:hypothetical protein
MCTKTFRHVPTERLKRLSMKMATFDIYPRIGVQGAINSYTIMVAYDLIKDTSGFSSHDKPKHPNLRYFLWEVLGSI